MMKIVTIAALICAVHLCVANKEFEPSVAFVCGRGAMHSSQKDGWVSDTTTDCLELKSDILAYCKKIYPTLSISNIVESSTYQHIRGWCPLKGECNPKESFKVRSYRCLAGPFQSDALIVPKLCHFDHVLEESMCKGFDHWREVAVKSCKMKNMNTNNFAMLVPCGTDVFTGVEFVCCPEDLPTSTQPVTTTDATSANSKDNDKLPLPDIKITVNKKPVLINLADTDFSIVDKYLKMKSEAYAHNEHDAYKLAKKQLNKVNHDKVAKLMKDWSEAKARVDDMKKVDPKGAEKLNKEITPRFQKEYFALQLDVDNRMLQLDSVHQQHVQSNLNSKKRKAAEKLMEALQQSKTDVGEITKYLQRYIAIEEKDAHHCLQHYVKVRNQDASAAEQMLPITLEHLSLISRRINQSFDLLESVNDEKVEEEIGDSVRLWLNKSYTSIDRMIQKLKDAPHPKTQARKKVNDVSIPADVTVSETATKPSVVATTKDNLYKEYADKLVKTDFIKKMIEPAQPPAVPETPKTVEVAPKMSHMAKGEQLAAISNMVVGTAVSQGTAQLSNAAVVAIVFGVVAALFVISFSIFVVKKQSSESSKSNNYLEVAAEDNISAEDRHIASMQNGYENPTYKFLERRA